MKLSERDFIDAAQELEVELPTIRAVDEVESRGEGFLPNGQPKILFEAHWFHKFTKGKYDITHPRLSSKEWNKKLYMGGTGEHGRLLAATKLDRESALLSTSWGRFQIMGFNYKDCGFRTLQEFINAMYSGEREQLLAFVQLIKTWKLQVALQKKQWAKFAEKYNGPGYKANKYDIKLEQAYKRYLS